MVESKESIAGVPRPPGEGGPYSQTLMMKAWEDFLSAPGRAPRSGIVRDVIENSWTRSSLAKVDAHGHGSPRRITGDQLEELRFRNQELLIAANDTVRQSGALLEDSGAMLIVTDSDGIILNAIGDAKIVDAAHNIRLEVGADWGEAAAGTNGIGTAIFTGQPVYVHAAEHYCEDVKAWTCAGAPIRSPVDGNIIGLVDISGPPEIFRRHNIVLSVVAASQIELALAKQAAIDKARLLEACLAKLPASGDRSGVVLLDRLGRIVHFDSRAQQRWASFESGGLTIGRRLADFDLAVRDTDIRQRLPEGFRGTNIEPLVADGKLAGAFLMLSTPQQRVTPSRVKLSASPRLQVARDVIVGNSEVLLAAVERAERAALGASAILLEGETGVGKELFARLIHATAQVTGQEPFVTFNCGAVSKDLLGSELFGHGPGAYTGATKEGRQGRFETANGGVLSLDEIGEMPIELQPYLLRVLEERAVYRLGESKPRPVDVRLVASTNRNLKSEVAEGRFRKDLFFRISAIRIAIPPLRERLGDVEILIDHFNRKFAEAHATELLQFQDDVLECLYGYSWPGNVRELRNLIETLSVMAPDRTIGMGDLPEDFLADFDAKRDRNSQRQNWNEITPSYETGDVSTFDQTERRAIEQAMAAVKGNMSHAAVRLGLSRSTVYRKLRSYRSSGS